MKQVEYIEQNELIHMTLLPVLCQCSRCPFLCFVCVVYPDCVGYLYTFLLRIDNIILVLVTP